MTALAPASLNVKIIAPPERRCSVWIGGSVLASMGHPFGGWISREEYEEKGSVLLHFKSFCTI